VNRPRKKKLGPYRAYKNEYFSEGIKYDVSFAVIYGNFFTCRDLKFKTKLFSWMYKGDLG
jgi:hypothetical protein